MPLQAAPVEKALVFKYLILVHKHVIISSRNRYLLSIVKQIYKLNGATTVSWRQTTLL